MGSPLHVGSEVEAYCGSCHDTRWHVAVALVGDTPVKVECLSCKKQHGFRTGPATPRVAGTKAKAAPRKLVELGFDARTLDASIARTYTPALTFTINDVVRHPTFGLGLVFGIPGPQRVEVRFESGPRLLVQGKK